MSNLGNFYCSNGLNDLAQPLLQKAVALVATQPEVFMNLGVLYSKQRRFDEARALFEKAVAIDMTLTAPGCPVAGEMPDWVRDAVLTIPEIKSCAVSLVFDPPWDPSRMSDEAKLQLNMF